MLDYLTADEERELAARRDAGDDSARLILFQRNTKLAYANMKRFVRRHPNHREDFESEALLGLYYATGIFDPNKGKFTTIATWWILEHLRKYLRNCVHMIRVPAYQYNGGMTNPDNKDHDRDAVRALRCQGIGGDNPKPPWVGVTAPEVFVAEKIDIDAILDTLSDRERNILICRYGLKGVRPESLRTIGDRLGLTRERVRQIQERSLEQLRGVVKEAG